MLTYLFKGLGQNIVSLTSDEMERIYEERMDKIKSLGLSGIMTASLEQELTKSLDEDEDEVESKGLRRFWANRVRKIRFLYPMQ